MRSVLLCSIAFAALIPGVALAQNEVLMRRPLPSVKDTTGTPATGTSTPTPTPTPGGTPAPSTSPTPGVTPTPTPTPPAGAYTPITNPGNNIASEAYGWAMDCIGKTNSCHKLSYPKGGVAWSDVDFSQITDEVVPDSSCVTGQSDEARAFLLGWGYQVPDGTPGDTDLCTGSDPSENLSLFYATGSCGPDGKIAATCLRYIFPKPYVPGASFPYTGLQVDPSLCAAQQKTPEWLDFTAYVPTPLDPSKVEASCQVPSYYSGTGAKCVPKTTSNPVGITCSNIGFYDDGQGGLSTYYVTPTYEASCDSAVDQDDKTTKALASFGYMVPSPDDAARCTDPTKYALFGATNTCVNSVTYDPGWPQSGMSHVTSGAKTGCYAIFGKDDPSTMVVEATDLANCQNQTLSAADRTFLHSIEPEVYPYDELPTSCTAGAASPLNYQRSSAAQNVVQSPGAQLDAPYSCGIVQGYCQIARATTLTFDLPYVCTDSAPNDYYGGFDTGLQSSYEMTGACLTERNVDLDGFISSVRNVTDDKAVETSVEQGVTMTGDPLVDCSPTFTMSSHEPSTIAVPGAPAAPTGIYGAVDNGNRFSVTVQGVCFQLVKDPNG